MDFTIATYLLALSCYRMSRFSWKAGKYCCHPEALGTVHNPWQNKNNSKYTYKNSHAVSKTSHFLIFWGVIEEYINSIT